MHIFKTLKTEIFGIFPDLLGEVNVIAKVKVVSFWLTLDQFHYELWSK